VLGVFLALYAGMAELVDASDLEK